MNNSKKINIVSICINRENINLIKILILCISYLCDSKKIDVASVYINRENINFIRIFNYVYIYFYSHKRIYPALTRIDL